ncbi:helix-turn-helix domain-containing protein [Demequina sp. SYSU T00192]|uniref:Helix-turn-helix domain-containing protein n=1 Tax=Demequina litoralis TaxID=3051660 RepID=A0ABT8G5H6_9MICO|nr:helix-turn-helix transcriptional regulator [Demequina sp. SYSU T00192]MDN4474378.1 helix-turn-helix domain-containing protein [Demequina sp. SYSU T00192]
MTTPPAGLDDEAGPTPLSIGRRVRALRQARGMTVAQLGEAIDRAASQVSVIENGRRELRVSELRTLATALGASLDDLLDPTPPSRRDALEMELARVQEGPLFASLRLPRLAARKSLPDEAIETILAMHAELVRLHERRASTPEEARRANTELRQVQRGRANYYPELEATARKLHAAIGHAGGPLSHSAASSLAAHLGYTLHYVHDLPVTTRSVTDGRHGRIYLPIRHDGTERRVVLLQALAASVLGHEEPRDYAALLRQRVEANYLAAALMMPEESAVGMLVEAKAARELSVEDLRDAFSVSYEAAAHRFCNLATEHLGLPVHFLKVNSSGVLSKAYENDDVRFPQDALGNVLGQRVCRQWSARQVFERDDRYGIYHQYTDKPNGTYWCTSAVQTDASGDFSVSVGTQYAHSKWFRGRDTTTRRYSSCPEPDCCGAPSPALAARWDGTARPAARINSSLLAATPSGSATGIDRIAVYEFLEEHAPDA